MGDYVAFISPSFDYIYRSIANFDIFLSTNLFTSKTLIYQSINRLIHTIHR